jgi:hypothetical protein
MCPVPTKCLNVALLFLAFSFLALSTQAQVAPSAYRSGLVLSAGAEGAVYQPDYADRGYAETGPQRLYGAGAVVDLRFTRWVQIEAEGRWLRFNEYKNIGENTYMAGPRVPIVDFHNWTPYAKVLFGWGTGTGGWLTGRAGTIAYGGGIEYKATRKLTIRPFDFEYQQWRVSPTLWPYGGSAGVTYTIR